MKVRSLKYQVGEKGQQGWKRNGCSGGGGGTNQNILYVLKGLKKTDLERKKKENPRTGPSWPAAPGL